MASFISKILWCSGVVLIIVGVCLLWTPPMAEDDGTWTCDGYCCYVEYSYFPNYDIGVVLLVLGICEVLAGVLLKGLED
ncbi:MAG: hypothetical protein KAR39_12760 [Thermoplasmata archaeon]|nr:hypothetical protein [Thermoplasmata archaeon]